MSSRAPRVHAPKVSSMVFLETVLKMGGYSAAKKKFSKPINHAEIARYFKYASPQTSYHKYIKIKKMVSKQSGGSIKLPHIRVSDFREPRKSNEYEQLVMVINRF